MKKILILLIRFYQKYLSPMKRTKCPYYPTCSCCGLEAIEKHGAVKGSILAGWRILRCNPFSHGGIDPVPEKFISFKELSARSRTNRRKYLKVYHDVQKSRTNRRKYLKVYHDVQKPRTNRRKQD